MIDIQSLHIGSHILFIGKREKVLALETIDGIDYIRHTFEDNYKGIWHKATYSEFNPIIITEKLLIDLGFKKHREGWIKDINQDYPIFIKIKSYEDKNYVSIGGSSLFFSYLHELEAFVYLIAKLKLIED